MEEDDEGTTRGTSCKKGICTLDRCIRDDTDKYDIQDRTYRVESEGVELLSVQGFSSIDEDRNPSQDDGWVGSSSIIAQSPFCRPLCGNS